MDMNILCRKNQKPVLNSMCGEYRGFSKRELQNKKVKAIKRFRNMDGLILGRKVKILK